MNDSSFSSPRRRSLGPTAIHRVARLAAVAAACAAWTPGDAVAEEVGAAAGPYVSFVFGDEIGIGYGLDAVVLVAPDAPDCRSGLGRGWGIGPALQLGGINASWFQVVAALAVGGAVPDDDGLGIIGEAGFAAHLAKGERWAGVHTGVSFQSPYFAYGFARAEWLLDSYSVGGGARGPQIFNLETTCVHRWGLRHVEAAEVELRIDVRCPVHMLRHRPDAIGARRAAAGAGRATCRPQSAKSPASRWCLSLACTRETRHRLRARDGALGLSWIGGNHGDPTVGGRLRSGDSPLVSGLR
jgi:hypothetical protein